MKDRMTIYTVTNNETGIVCSVYLTAEEAMDTTNEFNKLFTKDVYEYAKLDLPIKEVCNYIRFAMNTLGE